MPQSNPIENWPKISVITPSYNQGKYLEATINSVLSQNYSNLEYIVLDADSNDNSVDIIKKYAKQLTYWHSKTDGGQAEALEYGFSIATGEIYCWLNSDDVFLPNALFHVAQIFKNSPSTEFIYGNRYVIDENGDVIDKHRWPYFITQYHWANGQPLAQESCFWKAQLYNRVGGINKSYFYIMDYDLFYRMWQVKKFTKTIKFLGCIRIHNESKNTNSRKIHRHEMNLTRKKYNLKKPGYILARILKRLDLIQLKIESFIINKNSN